MFFKAGLGLSWSGRIEPFPHSEESLQDYLWLIQWLLLLMPVPLYHSSDAHFQLFLPPTFCKSCCSSVSLKRGAGFPHCCAVVWLSVELGPGLSPSMTHLLAGCQPGKTVVLSLWALLSVLKCLLLLAFLQGCQLGSKTNG